MMKEEVFRMEAQILKKLNFELSGSSVLPFLDRFLKVLAASEHVSSLALYYSQLQLLDYRMLRHLPSTVAAACSYLAFVAGKGKPPLWGEYVQEQAQCGEEAVKECVKEMVEGFKEASRKELLAAKKKFSQRKHMEVGRMEIPILNL
eukprot:TRINITY_DN3657_c0_g1_i1.p1 TRINITY_DN3657_c0_g1~~TRINITY_DN3657_c0_g1_i1.p1  ORF type:complete len:147 (-),score=46.94 TRINITY_DN3657_c0_g1_i1:41-481(-)